MGRVKLKIKRLESSSNRQVTYSKRRSGILKKAKEISVLCDIDIMLLMFSPNGKPTVFCGARSNIDEIVSKFAQLSPQERAKRKLESLEVLKKTFKKLDHDINIQDFLDTSSSSSVEELCSQLSLLKTQLTDVQKKISWWSNPEKVDDTEHLSQMESSLKDSLSKIRAHKENFLKQQLMPMNCTSQVMTPAPNSFENAMNYSLAMDGNQQGSIMQWMQNSENPQHVAMPDQDPSFLTRREIESLPSCSGIFSAEKGSEMDNSAFMNSIDHCSREIPLPNANTAFFRNQNMEETDDIQKMNNGPKEASSGFLNPGKEIEVDNSVQVDNLTQESSALEDLNAIACLRLQLGGDQPYYPYHLTPPDLKKMDFSANFQENPMNYQIPGNFDSLPRSIFENAGNQWTQPPSSCDMNIINEISFPQPSDQP